MKPDSRLVGDLRPAPYNPRKITKEQAVMLAKSMAAFGDLSGVVENKRSGFLVGGHQRLTVLDKTWPIVVTAEYDPPNAVGTIKEGFIESPFGRWLYRLVDWDENTEKMAMIAANHHGGSDDFPKLRDLLTEVDDGQVDMTLTGFDADALKKMIDWVPPLGQNETAKEDGEAAEELCCPKCGYRMGNVRRERKRADTPRPDDTAGPSCRN